MHLVEYDYNRLLVEFNLNRSSVECDFKLQAFYFVELNLNRLLLKLQAISYQTENWILESCNRSPLKTIVPF